MDFLANENFPLASIKLLRKAGYNVAAVIEDAPGSKDGDVLKAANASNQIILTFDRDYGELIYHYKAFGPAGVIYFRFDPANPEEPAIILLKILTEKEIVVMEKFTVVERNGIRQRHLLKR